MLRMAEELRGRASRDVMTGLRGAASAALVDGARGRRLAIAACAGLSLGGVITGALAFGWHPTLPGGDAWNYLAAGERLAAGHSLYSLSPGDRLVPIVPPFWTVPLLAPPPIAVAWRMMAPLGNAAMVAWGVAAVVAVVVAVIVLWRGVAFWPAFAILAAPVTMTALSGNVSAFLLAGIVATWAFRDRPWIVGALVAAMAAVKLTPAVLLVWLIAGRRWKALGATLVAGVVIGVASLVGAGLNAWQAWSASVPMSAASPLALATLFRVPTWTIAVMAVGAVAGTWVVTRQDRATFAAAVIAAALATPALYFQALAILLAAVAPWALGGERRHPELLVHT